MVTKKVELGFAFWDVWWGEGTDLVLLLYLQLQMHSQWFSAPDFIFIFCISISINVMIVDI